MKNFTRKMFGLSLLMAFSFFTNAQTVLWGGAGDPNGEFAGGLNDWTVAAIGDPDALWVWEADGKADQGAYSGTQAIQSPSVANGAMVFDSDFYDNAGTQGNFGNGVAPAPQLGELISPVIDLTTNPYVSLKFNQFYRNFSSTCMVAWSIDGGTTWLDTATINQEFLTNAPPANSVKVIPLFGAGGTSQFRFKFIFDANYYFWVIDDVSIIERPEFDLKLGDFFFSPASYAQPKTQIADDTMGFSVDVYNIGRAAQDDVMLKVEVLKGTAVIYSDEINIGTMVAESPDSTYSFEDVFIPGALVTGTYNLRYSISSSNTDFDASNNSVQQEFKVTSKDYAKEDGDVNFENGFQPAGGTDAYYAGNVYRTSNDWVDYYKASKASFSCAVNANDPIDGKLVSVYLLELHDDVLADYSNFENTNIDITGHPNLDFLGYGDVTFDSTYENFDLVTLDLFDLQSGNVGVPLNSGKKYFLMTEYKNEAASIFQGYNLKIKYFQVSSVSVSDQWYLAGFGPEDAAVIRMQIDLYSIADEVSLPDNSLTFYPNPASQNLNVDINLDEPTLANVTIADLNGRVIEIDEVENAFKQTRQYDVSGLANGTYIVRIATKAGTKTKKFVVQH